MNPWAVLFVRAAADMVVIVAWALYLHFSLRAMVYPGRSRLMFLPDTIQFVLLVGLPSASFLALTDLFACVQRAIGWLGIQPPYTFPQALIAAAAITAVGSIVYYWWTLRRYARLECAGELRCTSCDYQLHGLRWRHGHVRCPECGHINEAPAVASQSRHERTIVAWLRKIGWMR